MTKAKIKNSNELRKFIPKETGIKETKNLLFKNSNQEKCNCSFIFRNFWIPADV